MGDLKQTYTHQKCTKEQNYGLLDHEVRYHLNAAGESRIITTQRISQDYTNSTDYLEHSHWYGGNKTIFGGAKIVEWNVDNNTIS